MLVKYRGNQTAIRLSLDGLPVRLGKNQDVLLSANQVSELKQNDYTKQMIKANQLTFDDLSDRSKDELEQLALVHKVSLPEKADEKSILEILRNGGKEVVDNSAEDDAAEANKKTTAKK